MLTPEQRRAHFAFIQDGFRRRSHNLRRIVEAFGGQSGGWEKVARLTGKSVTKLHQIADLDHPWHTTIGDKLAREIEQALHLRPGALDSKDF
ncbi:MAG: hypothetical protein HRJ53_06750, partial [Acidobacteria bacterium Pan2503]|nr:hypothetical protein [Candidatus Acidoferrum panamensis]